MFLTKFYIFLVTCEKERNSNRTTCWEDMKCNNFSLVCLHFARFDGVYSTSNKKAHGNFKASTKQLQRNRNLRNSQERSPRKESEREREQKEKKLKQNFLQASQKERKKEENRIGMFNAFQCIKRYSRQNEVVTRERESKRRSL
jgi:hypothetical protein